MEQLTFEILKRKKEVKGLLLLKRANETVFGYGFIEGGLDPCEYFARIDSILRRIVFINLEEYLKIKGEMEGLILLSFHDIPDRGEYLVRWKWADKSLLIDTNPVGWVDVPNKFGSLEVKIEKLNENAEEGYIVFLPDTCLSSC